MLPTLLFLSKQRMSLLGFQMCRVCKFPMDRDVVSNEVVYLVLVLLSIDLFDDKIEFCRSNEKLDSLFTKSSQNSWRDFRLILGKLWLTSNDIS